MSLTRRQVEALLAILLIFVAARCLAPMDETDLFFNLRLGELVLQRHSVPRTNLLSFTYPDARDVNLAWLFQLVLVLAYRAGGIGGTIVLKTALVVGTWALLFRVALRRGAHPAVAAAALALAAWAAEPRFVERPHLVTFLGLATLLLAIERAEAGRPRLLLAMVPLGLIWANGNSCFFLAPAVLELYALGALLDRRRDDALRAALVGMALAPLVFATPSGVHALGYIANHWRMPWLRPLQEYRTASWPLDGPFFFVALGLLIAVALPGRRWRHALPAIALGLLGARRIRFVAEFAILAGPIVSTAFRPRLDELRASLVAGATLVLLAGTTLVTRAPFARMEPGLVPLEAIRFVDDNGLGDRMYNDLEVGSYLTWHWQGRHRVFQDPRINGYPPAFHAVLKRDDLSRAEWQELLDRFGVTTALVTYPDVNPRAALFDPARWALVYRDDEGLVFAARRPPFAALIARELPLTFTFARERGVTPLPLPEPPAGSPVAACEWQRRLGEVRLELGDRPGARAAYTRAVASPACLKAPDLAAARTALGDLALAGGDRAAAVDAYEMVDTPHARTNRGLALLALHRADEAEADLRASLAEDPRQPDARLALGFALESLGRPRQAAEAFAAFLALAPNHPSAPRARAELSRLKR